MASTSPYTGNDYQAVSNYRPYELPINDIFKGITAQNAYWEAGAHKVKSVYNDALNLDLTLDANKEVKKKFMQDADKQLTKLSTMDLSDPSVQRQGFNLFKPLFKDESIMYDSELTKIKKSIYADAASYRTRKLSSTGKEGEGYSDRNLAYSLDGFEEFTSNLNRDPSKLKELYGKLSNKQYTPYYDPTQEYNDVLKNCKGSATESQDVASNHLYFDAYSKSGANSSETANCFMMGLSEKAKQQIGIDGWAYYRGAKDPYRALADDHYKYQVGPAEQVVEAIKGKIKGIQDGGVSKEEQEALKILNDTLPSAEKRLEDAKKQFNNMVSFDGVEYARKNFTNLAGGVYLQRNYLQLGEAFKSDETSRKLTANAAGIAEFNAAQRERMAYLESSLKKDELLYKHSLDIELAKQTGQIVTPIPINPNVKNEKTGENYSEDDHKLVEKAAFEKYSQAYESLKGYIGNKNDGKPVTDAFLLNYAQEHSKKPEGEQDPRFKELMTIYNEYKDEYQAKVYHRKAIEEAAQNNLSTEDKQKLNTIVTLSDGNKVKIGEIRTREVPTTVTYSSPTTFAPVSSPSSEIAEFIVNGKTYAKGTADYKKLLEERRSYINVLQNSQKERDKLYSKRYYEAQGFISPMVDIKKNINVNTYIQSVSSLQGADEANGYKLFGHTRSGKDLIIIPLDKDKLELSSDAKYIKNLAKGISSGEGTAEVVRIGAGRYGIKITPKPGLLPDLPDAPNTKQLQHIERTRDFMTYMEARLKNRGAYASSLDIKNDDGTFSAYRTLDLQTPFGNKIRVRAEYANGQVSLIPSYEKQKGEWQEYSRSFSSPEELILKYAPFYNPQ